MPIPKKEKKYIPKTAKERVYQTLKEWIETNTLKPGEKIFDVDLATYFEVSRTPVREAMQLLADQKLIEIRPGKESRVAPIDLDYMREIYTILGSLHALAIRFAFPKITKQTIQKLETINNNIRAEVPKNFVDMDNRFHECILELVSNPLLCDFCITLAAHANRFKLIYLSVTKIDDSSESVNGHQQIIDALKSRDLTLAEAAVQCNFTYMLEKIDDFENTYQNSTICFS